MVRSFSIGFTTYCHKNERLEKGLQEHRVTFYKNIALRKLHILATHLRICKFRTLKHTTLVALRSAMSLLKKVGN